LIIVFCEFGGESLLGKAREIADSAGDRVLALISEDSIDPQRLIYLGADEVLRSKVGEQGNWIQVISDLISNESKVRMTLFPSGVTSNVIMGAVYSRARGKIGCYLDEADLADSINVAKPFDTTGFALLKNLKENTVCLVSLKINSLPRPFEDTSRYGKTREIQLKKAAEVFPTLHDAPEATLSSSDEITILVGASSDDGVNKLAQKLADKYHAKMRKYSGVIEVVYGPCVAIELNDKLRDLPEFKGDLLSLNSKSAPINAISDVAVINPEIPKILESLTQ
jgi:hypothetical protein